MHHRSSFIAIVAIVIINTFVVLVAPACITEPVVSAQAVATKEEFENGTWYSVSSFELLPYSDNTNCP
jgi:predicted neutral ceramidase superfamily lipid hydrolase